MMPRSIRIGHIPALLWGEASGRLFIAVHGNLSHKADTVIKLFAKAATAKGFQVLSFDLPEHGGRKGEPTLCKVQPCVEELRAVLAYAKTLATDVSVFGCSIGAYFSLLAYSGESFSRALFLSPVVDMQRVIQNMMGWFGVSAAQLEARQAIPTPIGQTLYWDYYCYVKQHPVERWRTPTAILYGSADELCERDAVLDFSARFGARLTVLEQGEHFFHTPEQLAFYETWLENEFCANK